MKPTMPNEIRLIDLEQENEWLKKELERKSDMAEQFANELDKDEEEFDSLYNEIEQLQAELERLKEAD